VIDSKGLWNGTVSGGGYYVDSNGMTFQGIAPVYVNLGSQTYGGNMSWAFTAHVDTFRNWGKFFDWGNAANLGDCQYRKSFTSFSASPNLDYGTPGGTLGVATADTNGNTVTVQSSGVVVTSKQWNYYVLTLDVLGNVKVYVNGTLVSSGAGKAQPVMNRLYNLIGMSICSLDQPFTGTIRDFLFASGTVFSADDATSLYATQNCRVAAPPPSPPAPYFPPSPPSLQSDDCLQLSCGAERTYVFLNSTLMSSIVPNLATAWTKQLDGAVIGQPAYASNVFINSSQVNDVLFVGTSHAKLYAISASSGVILWVFSGGTPLAYSEPGEPEVSYGIGGSPAVDKVLGLVYAVCLGYLYALNIHTGMEVWSVFVYDQNYQTNYGGLTLLNGTLYVTYGGLQGDEPVPFYGAVLAYNSSNGMLNKEFTVYMPDSLNDGSGGGIWGGGGAVVAPVGGVPHVWVASGNGKGVNRCNRLHVTVTPSYEGIENCGNLEKIIKLNMDLTVNMTSGLVYIDTSEGLGDWDFGATPYVFTPTSGGCSRTLVAAQNKLGATFLLYADTFETIGVYMMADRNDGFLTNVVYANGLLYVTSSSDLNPHPIQENGRPLSTIYPYPGLIFETQQRHGLSAYTVLNNCSLQFAWTQNYSLGQNCYGIDCQTYVTEGLPWSTPVVANDVVFFGAGARKRVVAANASNGALLWSQSVSGSVFASPLVVKNSVYFATYDSTGQALTEKSTLYAFRQPG